MNLKPSDLLRFLAGLVAVAALAVIVIVRVTQPRPSAPPMQAAAPQTSTAQDCDPPRWRAAARANADSLDTLAWAPFGRPETGWAIYAPIVAQQIGAACAPRTAGFAAAYARWQAAQGVVADGVFKPEEFTRLRNKMALDRPFVQLTAKGLCPEPPPAAALQAATAGEGYGGKVVSLRAGALTAYRRMTAAARAAGAVRNPDDFKLISGFRGPAEEAARCADGGCNTISKASCSAHRTGLAADIYLGRAPGSDPVSSSDENRKAIVDGPAYRWLAANGARYGFLNYPFEPWHWEWTGERP